MPETETIEVDNKKSSGERYEKGSPGLLFVLSADSLKRKFAAGVLFLIKNSDGIQHAEDRDTGVGEYREPHGGDSHET